MTKSRILGWLIPAVVIIASSASINAQAGSCVAPDFLEVLEFGARQTLTMAWGDHDNDGDLDLVVGNTAGQGNEHYTNNGDGSFTQSNMFGTGNTFSALWADPDNDGDLDMAIGQTGNNSLYVNNAGTFTQQTQFGGLRTAALAWADSDRDGDIDMAVGNGILSGGGGQQNALYINNADGTFTFQAQFGLLRTNTVAWADFDQDGDPDLAVGNGGFNSSEQAYLYVNNGNGTFTAQAIFGVADIPAMAWGDADNDGDLDLAVAHWKTGSSELFINNGDGTLTGHAEFGARDTNTIAWADFDLDGDQDVVVGNGDFTTADQNYLYVNDGTGAFTELAMFNLGSTDATAWADYDNDGDLDLALGNEHTPTTNFLYVNQCTSGGYLRLHLEGRFHTSGGGFSNRDGIGAKVSVYAAGHLYDPAYLRGFREVEAKGGFSCQQQIDPHFGLPLDSAVDVAIKWPGSSGTSISQELFGLSVNQLVDVNETASGDMDCNGLVSPSDIERFVEALLVPDDYATLHPDCNIGSADMNDDGRIDGLDVPPFVVAIL